MIVSTPAVVLQTYRYSETSKVVRLATRALGVQSAIAKGALRSKSPFGAGLELLSEGVAQLYHRDTRELQTLAAFDVGDLHRDLTRDVGRFAGAAALAEVMMKMAPAAPAPVPYDTLIAAVAALERVEPAAADAAAVRCLWLLVGALGFAPALDACVRDGAPVESANGPVAFSPAEGGVLCARCVPSPATPPTRLPPQAYRDLIALNHPAAELPALDALHAAAHRRLVARFIRYHLGDPGTLKAVDFWERRAWAPPPPPPVPAVS